MEGVTIDRKRTVKLSFVFVSQFAPYRIKILGAENNRFSLIKLFNEVKKCERLGTVSKKTLTIELNFDYILHCLFLSIDSYS